MLHRAVSTTALVAWLLLPAQAAQARCISAAFCLCTGSSTLFDATVTNVTSGSTFAAVNTTFGTPVDGGSPATLELYPRPGDAVGQRYLVFGDSLFRTRISGADRVQCNNIEVPLAEAVEISLAADCDAQLVSRGLVEPPCRDTGCACGSSGALEAAGVLLILGALGFRTRKRRRDVVLTQKEPAR